MAKPRTRGFGEATILQRRNREDFLAFYSNSVLNFRKMNARADWEHNLDVKAQANQVQRTFNQLNDQRESQLHSRRLRLAELYNREMAEWEAACLTNVETPEDRKQKMIQRALELKERREKERQAVVQEKMLQQYRESCDDLRSTDSIKRQNAVLSARRAQLEERKQIESQQRQYEAEMAVLWEQDRLKKEERDRKDREDMLKRNEEVKGILNLQVDLYNKRSQEETQQRQQEDAQLLDEWKRLRQVEEEIEQQNRRNEIDRAIQVKQFNQQRAELARQEAEKERQYDLKLLQCALQQEAEANRKDREQQARFKQEQQEFQQMLQKQMAIEAEDLSYLDQIRNEMDQQVWAKRDAQHQAEEQARQELLQQVLKSRQEQQQLHQQELAKQKQQDAEFMQQVALETEEELQKELRQQELRKQQQKQVQQEILLQKQQKQQQMEQHKQLEYLEFKRMQNVEKQHQQKVQQLATQLPMANYKRKSAQWYFDA